MVTERKKIQSGANQIYKKIPAHFKVSAFLRAITGRQQQSRVEQVFGIPGKAEHNYNSNRHLGSIPRKRGSGTERAQSGLWQPRETASQPAI